MSAADLPDELWARVLELGAASSALGFRDLCCLAIASRRLGRLSVYPGLWSELLSRDFPSQSQPSTSSASTSQPQQQLHPKSLYKTKFERHKVRMAEARRRAVFEAEARVLASRSGMTFFLTQFCRAQQQVIWLGDLNYRIALSYADTKKLLMENDWDALFEKDQLKIERDAGRVFKGWNEGKIYFAPTYKYSFNSDAYAGETATSKKKRRTPAWCDRILWRGDGIVQLSYYRGESRFSDHRPVCGTFVVEVEVLNKTKRRSSNADMRINAKEFLPMARVKASHEM